MADFSKTLIESEKNENVSQKEPCTVTIAAKVVPRNFLIRPATAPSVFKPKHLIARQIQAQAIESLSS